MNKPNSIIRYIHWLYGDALPLFQKTKTTIHTQTHQKKKHDIAVVIKKEMPPDFYKIYIPLDGGRGRTTPPARQLTTDTFRFASFFAGSLMNGWGRNGECFWLFSQEEEKEKEIIWIEKPNQTKTTATIPPHRFSFIENLFSYADMNGKMIASISLLIYWC